MSARTCKCGDHIPTKWITFINRESCCTCTTCGIVYKWKKVSRAIINWLSLILTIFIVEIILISEYNIVIKIILLLMLVVSVYLVTAFIYIKFAVEAHYDVNDGELNNEKDYMS